jgi:site-specific recombinase XerD
MQKYIDKLLEMINIRGLADGTAKTYTSYLSAFLAYTDTSLTKTPEEVTWDELRVYVAFLKDIRNLSNRTINAHISVIRFFTQYVLHKPWDRYQLPFRKFDRYLPTILTQDEMWRFIDSIKNLKHKAIIAVMYSAGLRVSEVTCLNYSDISRKEMRIRIATSKNRSERFAILSEKALEILTFYWHGFDKPCERLFPSTHKEGKAIVPNTVSCIIKKHLEHLGWSKQLNCHSFRHAFGTHLYENGVDLLTIQRLLGHSSINSTTIYVHLASFKSGNVKSPLDCIGSANG